MFEVGVLGRVRKVQLNELGVVLDYLNKVIIVDWHLLPLHELKDPGDIVTFITARNNVGTLGLSHFA